MQKYTTSEKFEVLRGEQAEVLHQHRHRLGKNSLTDFNKDELAALERDLSRVQENDDGASNDDDGPLSANEMRSARGV